jgi:C1A family cysteine protease
VETSTRFQNFKQSLQIISANNKMVEGSRGAVFALNKFSDLSAEEFRAQYLMPDFLPTPEEQRDYLVTPSTVAVPAAFDWRTKSKVTAIKNQGQCGSCWAFSATENIESVWMIKKSLTNHTMAPLAPQQIVDCDRVDGGCNGGDTPTAYKYVINAGGIETEKEYPYRGEDGNCKFEKSKVYAHITGYKYAAKKGEEAIMMEHVFSESPLSICVDAEKWQFYSHGVMTGPQCARRVSLDHCVQIIGYDHTHNPPYWLVRNSWGTDWGEKGLIMLEYGQNTCGVTDEATTAVIA